MSSIAAIWPMGESAGAPPPYVIAPAGPDDIEAVAGLFRAYADSLGVDLCFQGFAQELANLPGAYAAQRGGALLIARARRTAPERAGAPLGCVALRGQDAAGMCEMKRLYVAPAARGLGLGRALATAILDAARALGYRRIRLDTLPQLREAIALYRDLGFVETPRYNDNPVAGVLWLARALD